jgi:hypothetical protein
LIIAGSDIRGMVDQGHADTFEIAAPPAFQWQVHRWMTGDGFTPGLPHSLDQLGHRPCRVVAERQAGLPATPVHGRGMGVLRGSSLSAGWSRQVSTVISDRLV